MGFVARYAIKIRNEQCHEWDDDARYRRETVEHACQLASWLLLQRVREGDYRTAVSVWDTHSELEVWSAHAGPTTMVQCKEFGLC